MLRPVTALAVLVACVAAAPALAAQPGVHRVARRVPWLTVDGSRYAVWPAKGDMIVLDTHKNKRRRITLARPCRPASPFRDMVDGWLLLFCDDAGPQLLLDVATGRSKELQSDGVGWAWLGKRWIEGGVDFENVELYLNRRTGQIRRIPGEEDQRVRDLDDPRLRPICDNPGPGYLNRWVRFYDPGYYVAFPESGPSRLVLHRRCQEKGRVLARGSENFGYPFVAAGSVSWSARHNGYIENLRTRTRRHWRVPQRSDFLGEMDSAHTADTVFFAAPQTEDDSSAPAFTSWDVYAVGY